MDGLPDFLKQAVLQHASLPALDAAVGVGGAAELQPAAATDGADSIGEVPTSRVARSALGWSLLSGFFCTGMGGAYVISTYKTFGEQQASGLSLVIPHLASHLTSPHTSPHLTAFTLDPRRGTPTSTSHSSDR